MTAAKSRATSTALGQPGQRVCTAGSMEIQAILSLEAGTLMCDRPQCCNYGAGFQIRQSVNWVHGESFSLGRLNNMHRS